MFFLVFARDKPGNLSLRTATKAAHVTHLDAGDAVLSVLQTGPWLDGSGDQAGSLLIVQAETPDVVEAFVARDPYAQAGLFQSVEIHPWLWNRGNPYLQGDAI